MAVIEGGSQGFDFRAFQQQQANVPDPLPTATTSADAVTPPNEIETVDRFVQNAAIDRQRAVQSASNTQINTQSSEAVLNSRIEVAPDVDANQARNRYQETSGGPTTLPENYTQVALDA